MKSSGRRQPDWLGRIAGIVVFAMGIVLLVMVFVWTNSRFDNMVLHTEEPFDLAKQGVRLGIDFSVTVAQLFLMGFVAALIAGRGAQMYAAANNAPSSD